MNTRAWNTVGAFVLPPLSVVFIGLLNESGVQLGRSPLGWGVLPLTVLPGAVFVVRLFKNGPLTALAIYIPAMALVALGFGFLLGAIAGDSFP